MILDIVRHVQLIYLLRYIFITLYFFINLLKNVINYNDNNDDILECIICKILSHV